MKEHPPTVVGVRLQRNRGRAGSRRPIGETHHGSLRVPSLLLARFTPGSREGRRIGAHQEPPPPPPPPPPEKPPPPNPEDPDDEGVAAAIEPDVVVAKESIDWPKAR
jgi:hypothetical protein